MKEQLYRKLKPEDVNTLVQTTWDECSSSERSTAWSPREILTFIDRGKGIASVGQHFERQDHAESIRYFVVAEILNLLGGFVDTPGSVQFVKSESYVVLINMDLSYRYRLRREADLIFGEAQIATWTWILAWPRWPSSRRWDGVSSTSVEQSHAVTSSIEETQASKPQEQLRNWVWRITLLKSSSISTIGSAMIFLPAMMSTSILVLGKSGKDWQHSYDICKFWRSLFPKFRRDFGTWRCANLLRLSMAGSYTQRKQQTQISVLRGLEQQPLARSHHPRSPRRRVD